MQNIKEIFKNEGKTPFNSRTVQIESFVGYNDSKKKKKILNAFPYTNVIQLCLL